MRPVYEEIKFDAKDETQAEARDLSKADDDSTTSSVTSSVIYVRMNLAIPTAFLPR